MAGRIYKPRRRRSALKFRRGVMAKSAFFTIVCLMIPVTIITLSSSSAKADCAEKTLNSTVCPYIHYNATEDRLYAACIADDGYLEAPYALSGNLVFNGSSLACGNGSYTAQDFTRLCDLGEIRIKGTVFLAKCNKKWASIDLGECFGVADYGGLFDCNGGPFY